MIITVVIRDVSPFIHLHEPVTYRSVSISLTKEQEKILKFFHQNEEISLCFIETPVKV